MLEARRPIVGVCAAIAALCGVLAVHALPALPSGVLVLALAGLGALALLLPRLRLLGWLLLGFAWCAWHAGIALDARLPSELEGRDVLVAGTVDGLPLRRDDATRFVLRIEQARLDGDDLPLRGRVRVAWYDGAPEALAACDRWQLLLRLKRPRGLVNPGGFDAERQALERGIVAVGYVREAEVDRRLGARAACIDRLRESIAAGIASRVTDAHDAALLRAFAIGDTRGLEQGDWEVARANGIPHLIAISGFHVGVAGLFGVALAWSLWAACPRLGLRMPYPLVRAPAALLAASLYGLLAGGSLPTVRTLAMIAVVAAMRFGRRGGGGPHTLALALLAILAVDPLATLAPGFWLSFVGVAFLMLALGPVRGRLRFLRELGLGQLVMTIALLPLSIAFFGEASLVGALSNLVAVPVISFVIVPLCLLAVIALLLLPAAAMLPLALAAAVAHVQWWLLEQAAHWPGAHWWLPESEPWTAALAIAGALWLFLPRATPARLLGLLLFVPLLWPSRPPPGAGAFEALVIDVGQGLSVLVRTRGHALLFDAGARYPSDFDLGDAAVLPALHALGVDRLDRFVISHGDNDHAGGAATVARAFPAAARASGEPGRLAIGADACRAGEAWEWDGVRFAMLGPAEAAADVRGNDRSCVLLVEGRAGRLLLPGDISRRVEGDVAGAAGAGPPLAIIVPHHGSRSSSSPALLAALHPVIAVVSAGWRNRFHHPAPDVSARYAAIGAVLVNTADAGAVHLAFPADAPPRIVARERERQWHYWREGMRGSPAPVAAASTSSQTASAALL
ncbi:DNA internalization-related competence protein ComEC/Rec2 [Dokdonella fugitiva]|uniref:DNA internalization-related competence protein ComEC/Rec2 n=1 Tax=Dokdonella fugitiva TaxID=328517 RepID=UPI0015FE44C0|nr:DNA internalization-related competence protein ComEC/Rec2 [Dokdonella fugitiva]MBA8883039.1 competence protein ComEC [Dokdonella fugitiva]